MMSASGVPPPNPQRYLHPEHGLLPKVFIAYPHNPAMYTQIAPPIFEEILHWNPGLTRDHVQANYEEEVARHLKETDDGIRQHEQLVYHFATFLQQRFIAVAYDQLLRDTGTSNLIKWTQEQVADSDYLILITTPSLCDFLSNPPPLDKEYIFTGHYLFNTIHNPPPSLRILPVFLNQPKDISFLPKTLEAASSFEIWFDGSKPCAQGGDLDSLYAILTNQTVYNRPNPPQGAIIKLKPRRPRCKS